MAWGLTDNITPDLAVHVTGLQVYNAIEQVLLTHAAWEKIDSYVTLGNQYYIWKNLSTESGLPYDWWVTFWHDTASGAPLWAIMHEHYDPPTRQTGKYMCGTASVTPYYEPTRDSWYHTAVSTLGGTTQDPAPVSRQLFSTVTNRTAVQTLVTKDAIIGSTRNADGGFFYIGAFTPIATRVNDPMPLVFTSWQSTTGSGTQYPKYPSFTNTPIGQASASSYWFQVPSNAQHATPVEQITTLTQGGSLGAVIPGPGHLDNFPYAAVMSRMWVELPLGPNQRTTQTDMRGLYRHVAAPINTQRTFSIGTKLRLDGKIYAYLGDQLWVNTEAP